MKRLLIFTAVLLTSGLIARASDRTAVYALIDKVAFEGDPASPQRIQVWGVFAIAKSDDVNNYEPPQRGYLYFRLPDSQQDLARQQWNDFKSVAGTRQVVAFGTRFQTKARVRKADDKPESPDAFDVGFGVVKVRSDTEYGPIRSLLEYSAR